MQVAVGELAGGFKPVEDVEVEVVAAGGAVEDEGKDGDQRGEGEEDVGKSVALHGVRVSQSVAMGAEDLPCQVGRQRQEQLRLRGSLHCAAHDETVSSFGRDDDHWVWVQNG